MLPMRFLAPLEEGDSSKDPGQKTQWAEVKQGSTGSLEGLMSILPAYSITFAPHERRDQSDNRQGSFAAGLHLAIIPLKQPSSPSYS